VKIFGVRIEGDIPSDSIGKRCLATRYSLKNGGKVEEISYEEALHWLTDDILNSDKLGLRYGNTLLNKARNKLNKRLK